MYEHAETLTRAADRMAGSSGPGGPAALLLGYTRYLDSSGEFVERRAAAFIYTAARERARSLGSRA